jgi:hypothetical protein
MTVGGGITSLHEFSHRYIEARTDTTQQTTFVWTYIARHLWLLLIHQACTGFWWGNLRERDHWGDPGVDGRIILRQIFKKSGVWTGLSWLRIETGGGNL